MDTVATLICLSADTLANHNPELSHGGNTIPLIENPKLIAPHLAQETVVYFPHHLGGSQRLTVAWRQEAGGFLENAFSPLSFKVHQGEEPFIVDALRKVLLGVLELVEVSEWQIDPEAIFEVFSHIPDNIGELKAVPQADRVVTRLLAGAEEG